MKVMALFGSARIEGNTEQLADIALRGINHRRIHLLKCGFDPIIDERHAPNGFTAVNDGYKEVLDDFLNQDIVLFVTPLYWFGMSGQMKGFFDRWSQYMQDQRLGFHERIRGKKAYVIVVGENPHPRIAALPLIQQFHAIFEYTGMEFSDYIIGKGNRPGTIKQDQLALEKADFWNKTFQQTLYKSETGLRGSF